MIPIKANITIISSKDNCSIHFVFVFSDICLVIEIRASIAMIPAIVIIANLSGI